MKHIRIPWYSAGQKFGWIGAGIGLEHDLIRDNERIDITLGKQKQKLSISRIEAVELIKKYHSVDYRKGIKLGVIPLNAFETEGNQLF